MNKTEQPEKATNAKMLDRLSPATPNVNRPWDSFKEVHRRVDVRKGDRATHRVYHSLYEDMLN